MTDYAPSAIGLLYDDTANKLKKGSTYLGARPTAADLAAVLGNTNGSILAGTGSTLALQTLISLLEVVGSTRGQVLRRATSAWEAYALGSADAVLSSDGTDMKYQGITTLLGNKVTWSSAPTFTSTWTTNVTHTGFVLTVGKIAFCQQKIAVSGTVDAATLTLTVPSTLTLDDASHFNVNPSTPIGLGHFHDTGTAERPLVLTLNASGTITVRYYNAAGTVTNVTNTLPVAPANGDWFTFWYWLPIT